MFTLPIGNHVLILACQCSNPQRSTAEFAPIFLVHSIAMVVMGKSPIAYIIQRILLLLLLDLCLSSLMQEVVSTWPITGFDLKYYICEFVSIALVKFPPYPPPCVSLYRARQSEQARSLCPASRECKILPPPAIIFLSVTIIYLSANHIHGIGMYTATNVPRTS